MAGRQDGRTAGESRWDQGKMSYIHGLMRSHEMFGSCQYLRGLWVDERPIAKPLSKEAEPRARHCSADCAKDSALRAKNALEVFRNLHTPPQLGLECQLRCANLSPPGRGLDKGILHEHVAACLCKMKTDGKKLL